MPKLLFSFQIPQLTFLSRRENHEKSTIDGMSDEIADPKVNSSLLEIIDGIVNHQMTNWRLETKAISKPNSGSWFALPHCWISWNSKIELYHEAMDTSEFQRRKVQNSLRNCRQGQMRDAQTISSYMHLFMSWELYKKFKFLHFCFSLQFVIWRSRMSLVLSIINTIAKGPMTSKELNDGKVQLTMIRKTDNERS